jgi:hypothetical protein
VAAAGAVAAAAVALTIRLTAAEPVADPIPRDETAALVQNWMRHWSPSAHVRSCVDSRRDDARIGGRIWICCLWYTEPARSARLCVAVEEHVVRRQIGAGDSAAPAGARCQGRSRIDPAYAGPYGGF